MENKLISNEDFKTMFQPMLNICKELGWQIAFKNVNGNVKGIIIGEPSYIKEMIEKTPEEFIVSTTISNPTIN